MSLAANVKSRRDCRRGPLLDGPFMKLPPQEVVQTVPDVLRHRKELSVTIELDGFNGCIKHHLAVRAPANVLVQRALQLFRELPVQIFRDFLKGFFTGQGSSHF